MIVNKFEETRTNIFPDKITIEVDMFGTFLANGLSCKLDATLTITKYNARINNNIKIFE